MKPELMMGEARGSVHCTLISQKSGNYYLVYFYTCQNNLFKFVFYKINSKFKWGINNRFSLKFCSNDHHNVNEKDWSSICLNYRWYCDCLSNLYLYLCMKGETTKDYFHVYCLNWAAQWLVYWRRSISLTLAMLCAKLSWDGINICI